MDNFIQRSSDCINYTEISKMMITNNEIYKKIRVALALDDQSTLAIFKLAGVEKTRSYCKSIYSAESNRHFRKMTDDDLRRFLDGLVIYMRKTLNKK